MPSAERVAVAFAKIFLYACFSCRKSRIQFAKRKNKMANHGQNFRRK